MRTERYNKTYIGDSVYVEMRDDGILLTTENGISVTNAIVLEPQVYESLIQWVNSNTSGIRLI